jgi:hypothetical protein
MKDRRVRRSFCLCMRRIEKREPQLLFCRCNGRGRVGGHDFCGHIQTEHPEVIGGSANFGESVVESFGLVGLDLEDELVGPRLTVDGSAFDFPEIDVVACEGLERSEKSTGAVGDPHGEGHFAGGSGNPRVSSDGLALQENKARKVFGVVLDSFGEDLAAIIFGSASAGDSRSGIGGLRKHFADAAGGILRGHAFIGRVQREKALALSEGHRMRGDCPDAGQGGPGPSDKMHLDGQNSFRGDGQIGFEQEIVDPNNRASQGIFHRHQQSIGDVFGNGPENGVEGGTRNGSDLGAEKLKCGGFTEGPGLTLKSYAHLVMCWVHTPSVLRGSCFVAEPGSCSSGTNPKLCVLTASVYQV